MTLIARVRVYVTTYVTVISPAGATTAAVCVLCRPGSYSANTGLYLQISETFFLDYCRCSFVTLQFVLPALEYLAVGTNLCDYLNYRNIFTSPFSFNSKFALSLPTWLYSTPFLPQAHPPARPATLDTSPAQQVTVTLVPLPIYPPTH
jgi:hypothetical protein